MAAAAGGSEQPRVRLTYLDMKGIAEPIRLALFLAGVQFEDRRIGYEEVASMRASGELPFGQVPLLEVGDDSFSQAQAILRWAGRQGGLYPEAPLLQLRCDEIEEALADIRKALAPQWYGAALGRHPKSGEIMVPLSEAQKSEVETSLNEIVLPERFWQLERRLAAAGEGPFFCGERLSVADLSFHVMASGFAGGDWAPGISASLLENLPRLSALAKRVAELPKVQEWEAAVKRRQLGESGPPASAAS